MSCSGRVAPLRACRAILRELRAAKGPGYRRAPAHRFVLDRFRQNRVTNEKLCRSQQDLLHQASSYLCLLQSTRLHLSLHTEYHGEGATREKPLEDLARMVGLTMPTQPGGKGWE
ncbi:protein FMC1 homolog [Polyodon spathula]|uniref:protein FMC1 homolog n=1 Tax=Polyodon spathula TaxID=7913 RepID=UPI001B7DC797|nr:protein FMC1 homolog [Polyodon spathula]